MTNSARVLEIPGGLILSKEGVWSNAGVKFTHQGVISFFNSHLVWDESLQQFFVELKGRRVRVEVEDTPWVVTAIELDSDPPQGETNDGEIFEFNPEKLWYGTDNALYTWVAGTKQLARVTRAAYQSLLPAITEERGQIGLELNHRFYPLHPVPDEYRRRPH